MRWIEVALKVYILGNSEPTQYREAHGHVILLAGKKK